VDETVREVAERDVLREHFWTDLLECARERTQLHANITPNPGNFVGTGAGRGGLGLNYVIRQHEGQVELYIDRGDKQQNEDIFDRFTAHKEEIETEFGGPLSWERLDAKRACRIACRTLTGGYRDPEDHWPEIHRRMIEAMMRLERALRPHIEKLPR
jgi:hypothetical protein